MDIEDGELIVRNAREADAPQLCAWWNDGTVMAHAGFPRGLGTSEEAVRAQLAQDDDHHRRCIIVFRGAPVGEMNYRRTDEGTAEIGIKICEASAQNKGLGTRLLTLFIGDLFKTYGYERIVLDTNLQNVRAQHVYEKLGFQRVGVRVNAFKDQLGRWQSAVDYELKRNDWQKK